MAEQIVALIQAGARPGVYHATSTGVTTWHGLAREVFRLARRRPGPDRAGGKRPLPATGHPAGLQRARARRLGQGGPAAHRRVGQRAARAMPALADS